MIERREKEEQDRKVKVIDKRRVGMDEKARSVEPSVKPSYVEQLEAKVVRMEAALQEKLAELEAEAARSRERVARDLEKRFEDRCEALFLDVLVIMDNVEAAAEMASEDERTREGLELLSKSLEAFLDKNGLSKISPKGELFDPNLMEAVQVAPGEKNRVLKVYQCGYMRGDRLLKPAKVVVGGGA